MRQPLPAGPRIRIREHQNVKIGSELLDRYTKIIYLFAAAFGLAGDDEMRLGPSALDSAIDRRTRGILEACNHEEDFVPCILLGGQRRQIRIEAGLGILERANQRDSRRVKALMLYEPPLHHRRPLKTANQGPQPYEDLQRT